MGDIRENKDIYEIKAAPTVSPGALSAQSTPSSYVNNNAMLINVHYCLISETTIFS